MSNDENKALVRRFFEDAWNQGNVDVLDELYSPDFVLHPLWFNPALGGAVEQEGVQPAKDVIRQWRSAFPDLEMKVEDQIAEGDLVGSRHVSFATHKGEFQGIPPTGKSATVTGMTIMRIADGKIAEAWTSWDALGMMQQLGVAPTPGGPPPQGTAQQEGRN